MTLSYDSEACSQEDSAIPTDSSADDSKVVFFRYGHRLAVGFDIAGHIQLGARSVGADTDIATDWIEQQIRVASKKRDDLQEVMSLLKATDLELPLQFNNFRD